MFHFSCEYLAAKLDTVAAAAHGRFLLNFGYFHGLFDILYNSGVDAQFHGFTWAIICRTDDCTSLSISRPFPLPLLSR